MKATFIDSAFLIALVRSTDAWHEVAEAWRELLPGPFLTTEYILVEFGDACSPPQLRSRGARTINALRGDSETTIVPASLSLFNAGLDLYQSHTDKGWGLTDCISFALMRSEGIHDALTCDHHYEQAGFCALLREFPEQA